ncbi:succinic semialdehyde dehydrogenase [Streptomyces phyllanthi]|uniref:Succinate-semialdehyde dehydrogenase (NADP(+)) n=1 Tax=Streptomyces phyllanthi TaxID=1803180 RepID=A0A5N8W3T4_9ACTN|nr:succinic semialdehyde dehydrogenase [Streptomyces phyllanthi]MPY40964.1 succinate-semialdehyde dehydrogenase (NADP(+)) [Streptomyces phyllanthi]
MRTSTNVPLEPLLTYAVASAAPVKTVSSLTGEALVELPQSTERDVADAYANATRAQRSWAAVSVRERAEVVLRFHDLLLARQSEIIDLIQVESGKSRWHAFQEVAGTSMNARYYGLRGPRLLAPTRRYGLLPVLTHVLELRAPIGVVGTISPWNYPFELGLSDVLPALIAGNGVVHKPDNQGALSVLWGVRLLRECGVPDDLYQVVLGDGPGIGGAVVDRAGHISFTGSSEVGRLVAEKAGRRLIGSSLELGGKNPLLVLDDADPAKAASGAVRDCFTAAGQLCGSSERVYVHDRVYDAFTREFLDRIRRMRLGVGLEYGPDMGSLVSQRQLDTVTDHLEDAVAKGAHVLVGGRHRPDIGPYYFEPTVLSGVTEDMKCFDEETFGPVIQLHRCETVDEQVERANASRYGLNACVWTGDTARGREVAERLEAGTVNVNEIFGVSYGSVDAPMGGMKDSGVGRRHGIEGLLRFTEAQTVATQRGIPLEPPLGLSQETLARGYTTALRVFRAVHRR